MTKAEKQKHRSDILLAVSRLLEGELANGSDWIFEGGDDSVTWGEVAVFRVLIVDKLAASIRLKAQKVIK
jgi:hypothetical protein